MTKHTRLGLLTAATLALAAGCQHNPTMHGENFAPENEPRAVQNVTAAQAAAGARQDATLRAAHFSETGLNSLGQEKLDLMLAVEQPNAPLVVYLDMPAGTQIANSHDSVTEYLKGHGLSDSQIKLVDGPNPHTLHPAAEALTGLATMQQQAQGANGAPGGAAASTGTTPQSSSSTPTPAPGASDSNKY